MFTTPPPSRVAPTLPPPRVGPENAAGPAVRLSAKELFARCARSVAINFRLVSPELLPPTEGVRGPSAQKPNGSRCRGASSDPTAPGVRAVHNRRAVPPHLGCGPDLAPRGSGSARAGDSGSHSFFSPSGHRGRAGHYHMCRAEGHGADSSAGRRRPPPHLAFLSGAGPQNRLLRRMPGRQGRSFAQKLAAVTLSEQTPPETMTQLFLKRRRLASTSTKPPANTSRDR